LAVKACGCGKLWNALLLLSVWAASCASAGFKPVDLLIPDFDQRIPHSIAVLPMDNMSPDLDATPLIRPILQQRLIYNGYNCIPLDKIDPILKDQGVMISHDVYMFTPQELGKMLKADAVIYATVTDFNKHYAVFYSDIIVGLKIEMVDTRTGESLWKSEHLSTENTVLASILIASQFKKSEDALAAVAVYNAAFALLSSYRPYAESAIRTAMISLPFGPGTFRVYPWETDQKTWNGDLVNAYLKKGPQIKAYSPNLKEKKK